MSRGVQSRQRERRYNPLCETCNARPKMDRCGCCEECWYSGAWSRQQAWKAMTPRQRAQETAQRGRWGLWRGGDVA